QQETIGFAASAQDLNHAMPGQHTTAAAAAAPVRSESVALDEPNELRLEAEGLSSDNYSTPATSLGTSIPLPPLNSALKFVREVPVESVSSNIRPLGQLDESFIVATDDEGLLLIDQHVAHERVLFDKYRALEGSRKPESQQMLIPETFDLTQAQAAAFDVVP